MKSLSALARQNPHHAAYVVVRCELDGCSVCGAEFDSRSFYGDTYRHMGGVRAYKTCGSCGDQSLAMAECKDEGRRYTEIAIGLIEGNYNGDRCACGAVSLPRLKSNACVQCSIKTRMLDRLSAESRLLAATLRQLKKEIKTQLTGESNVTAN